MSLQYGAVYLFKSAKTGTYLNTGNGSDAKAVSGWQKANDVSQQWTAEDAGNGEFRLKNSNNLYLSVAGGPRNGADIVVGRYKQQWKIESRGSQLTITYPDTNLVLDLAGGGSSNGTKILLWVAHGGPNQSWIPEPLAVPDTRPLQNNSIYLLQNARGGTVASVSEGSSKSVVGWQRTGTVSQQWTVEILGNGEVRLKSGNNLYLGIDGGEPKNGGVVLVGRYKQSWRLDKQGSQYKFVYPESNFCLELDRGDARNGAKIQLGSLSNAPNQLWQSELVSGSTNPQESGETAKILKKNEPYKIVNAKSSTVFELSADDELVVGWKNIVQRDAQSWILEDAGSGQFFIKNDNGTYLGIEGPVQKGLDIICSPKKQPWSIRVDNLEQKTFKVFYPNTNLAIDLDRGSAASGTTILLWSTWSTPNQLWKFESTKPVARFELNRPYMIINSKSETSAELSDDKTHVVGYKIIKGRTSQQWTFENASSNQVYIKNHAGLYLQVDGDVDRGAPIICSNQKQAWEVKPDEKDPASFRITFPGSKYSVELDRGGVNPGTDVLLMSSWETPSQTWMLTPLADASDIKVHVTQYYNDEFFPTSTSGWLRARPKATALFYPVPSTEREYKPPVAIGGNARITFSPKALKELSGQDMWVSGDWRFATYASRNGRIRMEEFNLEGGNR